MPNQQQQRQHPMRPTDEQLSEWFGIPIYMFADSPEWCHGRSDVKEATRIFQAGADAQLEADKEWLASGPFGPRRASEIDLGTRLHAAMRPAPPTLRELRDAALEALDRAVTAADQLGPEAQADVDAIRAALQAMPVEPEAEP